MMGRRQAGLKIRWGYTDTTTMKLINARLPGYDGLQQLDLDDTLGLKSIQPMSPATLQMLRPEPLKTSPTTDGQPEQSDGATVLDMEGDWVSPGGIDLQINGGLGLAFPDLDWSREDHRKTLSAIGELLWQQGVDGYMPTLVTSSIDDIHRALDAIARAMASQEAAHGPSLNNGQAPQARILGVHLEGPCLNPTKRGAHPQQHLLPLTLDAMMRVLGDYAPIVRIVTLAPELDPDGTVVPYLRSLGITVSLGHSLATADEASHAFDHGATMVTHAFNAMPGLHHREPGLLGVALTRSDVFSGFIADGQHICPTMLDVLLRTRANLFLVSDALSPLGLPDGLYPWDTRQIQVTHGTARLLDGTLSGTTLPLLEGVRNLVRWELQSLEEAIALATVAPRRAVNMPLWGPGWDKGQPASVLRWQVGDSDRSLCWHRIV